MQPCQLLVKLSKRTLFQMNVCRLIAWFKSHIDLACQLLGSHSQERLFPQTDAITKLSINFSHCSLCFPNWPQVTNTNRTGMSWTGISDGTSHETTTLHSDWLVCSGEQQIAKEPTTNIQRQRFLGPSDAECLERLETYRTGWLL